MDAGSDTGPIVALEHSVLGGDETAPALEARLAIAASGLLARSLDPWLDGELRATPQPADGGDDDAAAAPLRRAARPIQPGRLLERQVRAYLPWPGTFLETDGQRLVVLAAASSPSEADDEPGRIVPDARAWRSRPPTAASSSTRSSPRAAADERRGVPPRAAVDPRRRSSPRARLASRGSA
jgi:methionyl-tRNA formyltransferase